jgi:uncharacterized protein (DUF58 family)
MSRWRSPRRLRFLRAGWALSAGAIVLGFVAIGTANNLLFLLLGALLGMIALSGSLSELVLRRVEVRRKGPRGAVAGQPAHLLYELRNPRTRLASFALEVGERDALDRAFVASVEPGRTANAVVERTWSTRGVYPLATVTLATSFPFGLFTKERDVELPCEVVVWPRSDRKVPEVRLPAPRASAAGAALSSTPSSARGEFRGLREYRPGDDPRDIHWRSTARRGRPVVREYDRDESRTLWICLDLRMRPGSRAEEAIEVAASLAERAARRGTPFAVLAGRAGLPPGAGPSHLAAALDLLARAEPNPRAAFTEPPSGRTAAVLVGGSGGAGAGWGAVLP